MLHIRLSVGLLLALLLSTPVWAGAFAQIPEANSEGYQLVYQLPISNSGNFNSAALPYSVNNASKILSGQFDRVAYYLELESGSGTEYVWASMDAFTADPFRIGVPAANTINGNGGRIVQQNVTNLNVVSNKPGIVTGTSIATGNLEFWPNSYAGTNSQGVPNAGGGYDTGDQPASTGGYGSMQIHNHGADQTLLAYNRWGSSGNADLGIGNRPATVDTDWTFAQNANSYTVKNLEVLVRPSGTHNVFGDVPEANSYQLLYALNLPTSSPASLNTTGVSYAIDNSAAAPAIIDRVAYYLELKTPTGAREYAYASMDAFSQDPTKLGLPVFSTGATFEQDVHNMNVYSNAPGVVNGTGIATGNLEFWSGNYGTPNDSGVPGGNGATYDTDDQRSAGAGYGSMQIHNHGADQTVLAYNAWGAAGRVGDVGIGNQSTSHPDWTFAENAGGYEISNLYVLVQPGTVQLSNPTGTAIYQRDNSNQAQVLVEGIFDSAQNITAIEARAVPRAGFGGAATDWTVVDSAPAGGVFSSELTLSGGWYDLEVRALNGASVLGQSRVEKIGVGEIFVTAGQSNSANHGDDSGAANRQTPSDERVLAFNPSLGAWQFATDPQPMATGTSGSPWPALGDALTSMYDVPVGFYAVGWGGTSVAQWLPGAAGPAAQPLYDRLLTALETLGPDGARAVLWHQGESDNSANTSTANYAARMQTIIDASRTDAGFDVPWLLALVSYVSQSNPLDQNIIDAQLQVIAQDPCTFLGPLTDDMIVPYRGGTNYTGIHFNSAGLTEHGQRWAASLAAAGIIPNVATSAAVPEPSTTLLLGGLLALLAARPIFASRRKSDASTSARQR